MDGRGVHLLHHQFQQPIIQQHLHTRFRLGSQVGIIDRHDPRVQPSGDRPRPWHQGDPVPHLELAHRRQRPHPNLGTLQVLQQGDGAI